MGDATLEGHPRMDEFHINTATLQFLSLHVSPVVSLYQYNGVDERGLPRGTSASQAHPQTREYKLGLLRGGRQRWQPGAPHPPDPGIVPDLRGQDRYPVRACHRSLYRVLKPVP